MTQLAEAFFRNARSAPGMPAIWCEGAGMTYGELANLVMRWSGAMATRGIQRGDHIGVLLPNCMEFVALMLAAADLGAVLVPLNTSLPPSAVRHAFRVSGVRHVVAKPEAVGALLASGEGGLGFVDGLWVSLGGPVAGVESLADLLADSPAGPAPLLRGREEDPFILTMTSGSTGDPKPIVLTQQAKSARARAAIEMYGVTSSDRTLAATPLYHSLAERLVLIPLLSGGTSVLMARYSPSEWLRCVREQGVTFTIAVSSQLRQIATHRTPEDEDATADLRCVVSSSAQLEPQAKAVLLSRLRCGFHECYGTSEIAIATDLDVRAQQAPLRSVGRAAPGVDVKILREDGQVAAPGEPGEIVCKTPLLFSGYYERPDLTSQAMWGDYFRTGDIGTLDQNGYLFYLGREKDIIITGGINVYPEDVEAVLMEYPSVSECAAFALEDENLGEVVAVAMVPRDPTTFDLRRVRLFGGEHLADFQQPRKYFVLDALPKNDMGKIMKRLLPAACCRPPGS